MQIKTTMKYHLTSLSMAIIKKLQTITAGEDVEKWEYSYTVDRIWIGIAIMQNSMEVP